MRLLGFFTSNWEYTLAMKKLAQVGHWDHALDLWSRMRAKGLEESPASGTAVIIALQVGGFWRQSLAKLDEMERNNMLPLKAGVKHALMACESGGSGTWTRALALFDRLWEYGEDPDESVYMPTMRALERGGQFNISDQLFWQMRENTKMTKVEDEMGWKATPRKPPKAIPTPWRLPGAVALDAYDAPKLLAVGKKDGKRDGESDDERGRRRESTAWRNAPR